MSYVNLLLDKLILKYNYKKKNLNRDALLEYITLIPEDGAY